MAKKAHIYIYGGIAERSAELDEMLGAENYVSSKDIATQLSSIKEKEVDVHINSSGGSVTEGYATYDVLKASGKKINTIGEGKVQGIATVVFLAGEKRSLAPHCDFTIHNPWIDPSNMGKMEAKDFYRTGDSMEREENKLALFYNVNTKANIDDIKAKMAIETTLTAQEAIEMGFATEILQPVKSFAYFLKTQTKENKTMSVKLGNLAKQILNVINGTAKAQSDKLKDGKEIYHDGQIGEGVAVFSDEAMAMPCADGDYELENGDKITVKDGMVEAIVKAPAAKTPEEIAAEAKAVEDAAKAKADADAKAAAETETVKNLKKEIETKDAELKALKDAQLQNEASLLQIMNEVKTLKKTIPGGAAPVKIGSQTFIKEKHTGNLIPQPDIDAMSDTTKRILNASK